MRKMQVMHSDDGAVLYRPYQETDLNACMRIFRDNVPAFFAAGEEADFEAFLLSADMRADYFVIEQHGHVVACGGCFVRNAGIGGLAWGMVARNLHRHGYGSLLLNRRIERLRQNGARIIRLDTSQHSTGFFERFGFVVTAVKPDAYGPGLDQHDMTLVLA